jgi:hypothetical protein
MASEQVQHKAQTVNLDKVIADSVQSRAHEVNGSFFGVGAPGLNRLLFYRQKTELDIRPTVTAVAATALRRVWRLVGADIIASAIAVMIQKVQATAYVIEGPQRTVNFTQQSIDLADLGRGWLQFVAKWVIDFTTQDNGAFVEKLGPANRYLRVGGVIVRHPDGSPVIDVAQPLEGRPLSFSHMDSIACERTGCLQTPVRYYDINGSMHLMHYTRMHWVADMPQPDERLFGYGFCALSRCISMVQYMVNWATARNESLDNMPPLSIHEPGEHQQGKIRRADDGLRGQPAGHERAGAALAHDPGQQDPTKPTGVKLTPIRQLWESFDEQKAFQITVNTVAMAFGLDPQDLAPLSSTAMGSAAQSSVLSEKAHGKGVGNVLAQIESMMREVIPASCTFRFDRQDDDQDLTKAQIRETKVRALTSLYGVGGADTALEPNSAFGTGLGQAISKVGLVSRDEARRILMFEIPEWADLIDPDMALRDMVVVDDLDPEVADMQAKMYGPKVRYHSKSRRTAVIDASPRFRTKAQRADVPPVTEDEIAEARKRLADIGINVDELRPTHA